MRTETPDESTPAAWRDRWDDEAAAFGTPGMPTTFLDAPNAGQPVGHQQAAADEESLRTLERVRRVAVPALVRVAEDRGWWTPSLTWAGRQVHGSPAAGTGDRVGGRAAGTTPQPGTPVVRSLSAAELARLRLAPRTIPPFDPVDALAILWAAAADGARVVGAIDGDVLVGVAVAVPASSGGSAEALLVVGVAPAYRRRGLGRALLGRLVADRPAGIGMTVAVNAAERDVVDPLDVALRIDIASRLLRGAGFDLPPVSPDVRRDDPWAIDGRLPAR